MTALGSVHERQHSTAASDDLDEQLADEVPPTTAKPRLALGAGAVAGIAATLIAALITVGGVASVAAFNALRDDIGMVRADMGSLRAELKGDMGSLRAELKGDMGSLRAELKGDIAGLRAEMHQGFAEVHAILRDHTERLAGLEVGQQHNSERLMRLEAGLVR